MLHNKRRKSKGENYGDFKDLHARNDARKDAGSLTFVLSALCGRTKYKALSTKVKEPHLKLVISVGLLTNEGRYVEIVGACTHHRPREIVGRP